MLITHVMPAPAPAPARLGQSTKCGAQKFWPERQGEEGLSKDSVNCVTVVSVLPRAAAFARAVAAAGLFPL